MSQFYELAPKDAKGEPYPFEQLKGKVVLIVNVAPNVDSLLNTRV